MVTSAVWTASAASGFFLGLSLIVAIGAQNAFVLRQGLRREHVLAVVAICALSDLVLIVLGIAGAGIVFDQLPWLVEVVRWVGAAFLVTYGALAARRAIRPSPQALVSDQRTAGTPLLTAVATCLALTWLNPHVYLDTLVLLGSVGSTHGDARWAFARRGRRREHRLVRRPRLRSTDAGAALRAPARLAHPGRHHRRRDVRHRGRAGAPRPPHPSASRRPLS